MANNSIQSEALERSHRPKDSKAQKLNPHLGLFSSFTALPGFAKATPVISTAIGKFITHRLRPPYKRIYDQFLYEYIFGFYASVC